MEVWLLNIFLQGRDKPVTLIYNCKKEDKPDLDLFMSWFRGLENKSFILSDSIGFRVGLSSKARKDVTHFTLYKRG